MPTSPPSASADTWKYQAGKRPRVVTAFERPDRANVVTVRWWDGSRRRFLTRSLQIHVRDDKGKLDKEKVSEAEEEVDRFQAYLLLHGKAPPRDEETSHEHVDPPASETETPNGTPVSLEAGLNRALEVPDGMYPAETEHVRECRRAKRDILRAIGRLEARAKANKTRAVVKATMPWEELRYRGIRQIWQEMAREHERNGHGGRVWTERCVVLLIQVSSWLHVEVEATSSAVSMAKKWRNKLSRDWEAITKESPKPQRHPRFSLEEARLIMAMLDHPDVDPRIRLLLEVGFDARLGQAGRGMRSHLDLSPVGEYELGRLVIPGSGNKRGVERDLTPSDRAAVDRALASYLEPMEAAYQRGELEDYALAPAGRLRYNIAPSRRRKDDPPSVRQVPPEVVRDPSRAMKPADDHTIRDWFLKLEELAGVAHERDRAWYGLRRLGTDIAEDEENDQRVLNALTGHVDSATRRRHYQERERPKIRGQAARLRHRLRTEVLAEPGAEGDDEEAA